MKLLGIRIDEITMQQAEEKTTEFFVSPGQKMIFTPNPEMLVDAQTDKYFQQVLNRGSLNICDGVGLRLVTRGKLEKISGADFLLKVCQQAVARGQSVYLLGSGSKETIETAAKHLLELIPGLAIAGFHPGLVIGYLPWNNEAIEYNQAENREIISRINRSGPAVLFVGFGHRKQEKWIFENLKYLPTVKIAMGVGGAFDFLSGKVVRAPLSWQNHGLEWLWRFLHEPWRIKRIWKATVNFIWIYVSQKRK